MTIENHFDDLYRIRQKFISYLESYQLNQLLFIPMGFKNHIFWNCAHSVVTQQLMTYYLSGNQMLVEMDWVSRFKKGTFGSLDVTEDEVTTLIQLLNTTTERLRDDYFAKDLFDFKPYQTSFGIELNSIEDAIRYNNIHESLHLGYIMAMSKMIPNL